MARSRKSKHHPLVIAGVALAGVGIAALLYEKYKTPTAPVTTNVQGAQLPANGGGGVAQPTGG